MKYISLSTYDEFCITHISINYYNIDGYISCLDKIHLNKVHLNKIHLNFKYIYEQYLFCFLFD